MSTQKKEFIRFIKLLHDNDLLEHVILIGSWAEFIYKEAEVLPGFESNIKTLDIDFLLKNLRKPNPPMNLSILAKEAGYLVEEDRLDGTTKIFDKEGLEIEFLINKLGAGKEDTLKTNIGVTAQALRHLEILLKNSMKVNYIDFQINIPMPEAYVAHKIVINKDRKNKKEKDIVAIKTLWQHIDKSKFNEIYLTLSKKDKKIVELFIEENKL